MGLNAKPGKALNNSPNRWPGIPPSESTLAANEEATGEPGGSVMVVELGDEYPVSSPLGITRSAAGRTEDATKRAGYRLEEEEQERKGAFLPGRPAGGGYRTATATYRIGGSRC